MSAKPVRRQVRIGLAAALAGARLGALVGFVLLRPGAPAGGAETLRAAAEVRALAGAAARLVWCQDAGGGTDAAGRGNALRLMGLDTDDGRGERRILERLANYTKPMLTPDGRQIIFSNRQEQKIYAVGFDGSGLRALAPGIALAVARDALTETDWIYAGTLAGDTDSEFNSIIVHLRRFRRDQPEVSEPVWSQTPLNLDNFQLAADGRHAGGQFPWPVCGVAELPDGAWQKFGDGCWPALSPDNELLLWIFDGAHRNLAFVRTGTGERWVTNINHAPGIDGFEVYHPRWSNHPRFMTMTGPYKVGAASNRIAGGGPEVEVYLGQFSADHKKIERWIQVTHNQSADFFPDLWLARRPPATPAGAGGEARAAAAESSWPGALDGLVFCWQNRAQANTFTDPATRVAHTCLTTARGRARYGRHFEMAPAGGAFIAEGGAGELGAACAARGQLAVEIMITPDANAPEQLLPIIGYAARTGGWNFLLSQQGRRLVLKIRAAGGGPDYALPLGALAGNEPSHIVVSCSSSSVACFLNGELASQHASIFGGRWEPGAIVFGNELRPAYAVDGAEAPAGWRGLIENVALYARWIGPQEARKKFTASAASLRGRQPPPVLSVSAQLLAMPGIPAPAAIAPYRRALTLGHYRIEKVTEGACTNREVMVAQWAILDGQPLAAAQQRRPGETYRLKLEPFAGHPELESERQIMDSDRFDLPVYYAVADP